MSKKKLWVLLLPLLLALSFFLSACTTVQTEDYIFGTFYSLELKGLGVAKAEREIKEMLTNLDLNLSTSILSSDISKLNQAEAGQWVEVSPVTIELFKQAKEINTALPSFNPAIFPLVELWEFSPNTYTGIGLSVPSKEEIDALLPLAKLSNFILDESKFSIAKTMEGAKIDFGAIAKGYAVDLAYSVAKGTKSVINIGGTIKTNNKINVAIASPRGGGLYGRVAIENESISTSGDYERYYMIDGIRYHHIIGRGGYPSGVYDENPVIAVTVVGESAAMCDALSTSLMIEGEGLKEYVETIGYSALIVYEESYLIIGDKEFEIYKN